MKKVMKKTMYAVLVSATSLAALSPASAGALDGFFVGAEGGLSLQDANIQMMLEKTGFGGKTTQTNWKSKRTGGAVGLFLNAQKSFGNFFYGIQLGGRKDLQSTKDTGRLAVEELNTGVIYTGGQTSVRFRKDISWIFSNKFGYAVSDCLAVYAKVSALNSSFDFSRTLSFISGVEAGPRNPVTTFTPSKKQHLWGFEVGAGVEYAVPCSNWNVTAEYGYQVYSKFNNDYSTDSAWKQVGNVAPRYHTILVGLKYKITPL